MSDYDRNSYQAVLSRLETKLDEALKQQDENRQQINHLWGSLNKMQVRVAGISAIVGLVVGIAKSYFFSK